MVQAWPFVHLPLGNPMDMPHAGSLQAVLEALEGLLAQKVHSRRYKLKGHADCPGQKVPDKYQGQISTNQQPVARQTDGREGAKTLANQEKPTRDKRPISTLEPDSKRIRKGPAASVSARVYRCRPPFPQVADSLCLFTHPPPGVLPESDRPIKAFINGP
ncbi:unnamed protein product [Rangifer tarandus platyrhynchus]